MREQLPLATIHQAVLEFLRGRDDVVVFGTQAVNIRQRAAHESGCRLNSIHATEIVEQLREYLSEHFPIAVHV
jgi:hypothetical protein